MKTKSKRVLIFKETFSFYLICSVVLLSVSCSSDDDSEVLGNWVDRSIFDGTPRSGAIAFTIGTMGYMGTGYDGDDRLKDFWVYDMDGNFWSQLSMFPGKERSAAVAFAIDDNGYVGLGYDGDNELKDFYKYNLTSNTWSQVSDFGGNARRGAIAFSSEIAGYVGTGYDGDNDRKDFWKYNPTTDSWTEIVGFGGNKRRDAASFTIGTNVYMGTGISNGSNHDDFWVFDMTTEVWTALDDLDDEDDDYDVRRNSAVGFSMNGLGYFATGSVSGASGSIWEYDPISDTWEEKTDYEGAIREDAIAFYNGSRAFVALGRTGSLYLDDNREFFPFEEEDEDD